MATKAKTKQRPRVTRVETSWMKRQKEKNFVPAKQKHKMGSPTGNYSAMESYLREHEGEKPNSARTVELMESFKDEHECTRIREIAYLKVDQITWAWYACDECGTVIKKRKSG